MLQLHRLKKLKGYSLDAEDGEIGKVEQVFFDDRNWAVHYFVVHTRGWLLGREVLIAPCSVTRVDEQEGRLSVALTLEKVKNSPPVDSAKPVSRLYEEALFSYYEWERYWITDTLVGLPRSTTEERSPPSRIAATVEPSHLRSSDEVRGYSIHTLDGDIGQVADFVVDQQGWKIRYLEVDTGHWLPGRCVLVVPDWIDDIDWNERRVTLNLSQELIRTAPSFDSKQPLTPEYESQLYQHYGKQSDL